LQFRWGSNDRHGNVRIYFWRRKRRRKMWLGEKMRSAEIRPEYGSDC